MFPTILLIHTFCDSSSSLSRRDDYLLGQCDRKSCKSHHNHSKFYFPCSWRPDSSNASETAPADRWSVRWRRNCTSKSSHGVCAAKCVPSCRNSLAFPGAMTWTTSPWAMGWRPHCGSGQQIVRQCFERTRCCQSAAVGRCAAAHRASWISNYAGCHCWWCVAWDRNVRNIRCVCGTAGRFGIRECRPGRWWHGSSVAKHWCPVIFVGNSINAKKNCILMFRIAIISHYYSYIVAG